MTRNEFEALTRKQLQDLARRRRILGWHAMRKEELIEALHQQDRKDHRAKKPVPAPRPLEVFA